MNTTDTCGYAVRKDVRNHAIVREIDERRQHELWRSVGVGLLFVTVLLFTAWQHLALLEHGYKVDQMQRELADQQEISRQLRLEIETLRSPQRIETLATDRLGLVEPGPGEAVVIERVVPPQPPPGSVVASK